ncbi:20346_t:CDS:1, partial [Gigaspora rosea]
INAQTQWDGCQDSEGNPIPQLNVAVTPDPPGVGSASFSISGNLGDSVPVLDMFFMYMNDTNSMVWDYGDFICGGDGQTPCQSVSNNNFEMDVTINFPVLMESINIVIYDTNMIPDESPFLGCVYGYFRDSRQLGTLPLT